MSGGGGHTSPPISSLSSPLVPSRFTGSKEASKKKKPNRSQKQNGQWKYSKGRGGERETERKRRRFLVCVKTKKKRGEIVPTNQERGRD